MGSREGFAKTTWYGFKIAVVLFLVFTLPLYVISILLVGGVAQLDMGLALLLALVIGLATIPLGFYALGWTARKMR